MGNGRIIVQNHKLKIKIRKRKNSKLFVNGNLRFQSNYGSFSSIFIDIGENASLVFENDFAIGNGARIVMSQNSELTFGGKDKESDSGITSDTFILVFKKINIGKDFICAWNVFISDSDWHIINNQPHHKDIIIGNHVWIGNNTNILKGTYINDNCIIASNSKLINNEFSANSLIGGIPAKTLKSGINWKRDIEH